MRGWLGIFSIELDLKDTVREAMVYANSMERI